ncbi:aldolase/citrate lyase family protein [Leucothrix pacifica]|uniref:2-keto-3-deoxy-L-rhamnonate aldolase n=1 Tax=Leucothrix pacifica TaxID=1247513 RepID=A0A317CRF8_9GAMM|nr:HpcH/HpaI aldolase/citrate lyase family protein [Leucothrix pacifica]PWR00672.1 2-keto-3-deoxy-L-rhamnonate aldolase [Leucothrix pacifica]
MKIPENTFKKALLEGKQQYGYWLGLCNPLSAELCGHAGYDWLLVDGEHAPNTLSSTLAQLQAIAGTPAHPVVRIAEGTTSVIKQYLDAGAQTLLIPMVETAEQARELVQAVQYPPKGVRGVGTALARASRWNMVDDYFGTVDAEMCLLVQVESVTALENLDEILAVDGVDGVFIGPADLAASMGHLGNPAHPEVKAAVETATRKIRKAGKPAGTLATSKAVSKHYESVGMQFIALGVDTMALAAAAKNSLINHLAEDGESSMVPEGNGAY